MYLLVKVVAKKELILILILVYESDDIISRIFDGDSIFVPKLSQTSKKQIPKSILSGLLKIHISDISGRIENLTNKFAT